MNSSIFIDYPIIDHHFRIERNSYSGKSRKNLSTFKEKVSHDSITVWMAQITKVEMLLGTENPFLDDHKLASIKKKDDRKLKIAENLNVKWLSYPCAKVGDDYSRIGISFTIADSTTDKAENLEKSLLKIDGISAGDARQIVSFLYGSEVENKINKPTIDWFLSEDEQLRKSLKKLLNDDFHQDLNDFKVGGVSDFISKFT